MGSGCLSEERPPLAGMEPTTVAMAESIFDCWRPWPWLKLSSRLSGGDMRLLISTLPLSL